MTEEAIRNYLDSRIGGRYHYRFEAHWYPVSGYTTGSDIEIGEPVPIDAFRQGSRVSLPLASSPSYSEIFDSMNITTFMDAVNSSDPSAHLHEGYNKSIETASMSAAETITSVIFPADYLLSLSSMQSSFKSEQLALISSPANGNTPNPEYLVAIHSINHTVNGVFGLNVTLPEANQMIGVNVVDDIENSLIQSNSAMISTCLKEEMQPEIERTISEILNSTDPHARLELHESQMQSIFSRVNNGGTDMILYLWQ